MIPIKGHAGLMRDPKSGGVINISNEGEVYSIARAKGKADAERLNKVEQDISEIKDMLKQLIER